MTDKAAKSLMAAIIRQAVVDLKGGYEIGRALSFLKSEWGGMMFEELGIDQKTVLRELGERPHSLKGEAYDSVRAEGCSTL